MVVNDQEQLEKELDEKKLMLSVLYDDMANLMKIHSNELLKKDQEIAKLRSRIKYLEKTLSRKRSFTFFFHKFF